MTERRYTLGEITGAMGEALQILDPVERAATSRQVDVVLQGVIDLLKALVWEEHAARAMMTGESWIRVTADGAEMLSTEEVYEKKLTADENAALHGYASPND